MSCPIGTDVAHAAALLRAGKVVAFATETVYGLGGHALDTAAVARIFEVKGRPTFDPLIVHVADVERAAGLAAEFPRVAKVLADAFWPGPLTLVLPKAECVPDLVTSGLPSVALRVPGHSLALELLRRADVPVAAPSANPFGRISPTRAEHVAAQLGERIDYILDGGPCRVGVESTVLALTDGRPTLLRPGGVPVEEIEAVIGRVAVPQRTAAASDQPQAAPGMLSKHYAPRTPLVVIDRAEQLRPDSPEVVERLCESSGAAPRIGLLAFGPVSAALDFAVIENLSLLGDLTEAAANLFAALRRLDDQSLDVIVAPCFPEHGLGRALNDRLRRAMAR